jgi:type II secretory pathway pseudopilin PulG
MSEIMCPKQRGVSTLELVVVIVIILILALVSFFALNDQQAKARDAKRISDIKELRVALAIYFNNMGEFPVVEQQITIGNPDRSKLCSKDEGGFVPASAICNPETTFMASIPTDPINTWQYTYSGTAEGYDISFKTEEATILGGPGIYHAHRQQEFDLKAGNN